MSVPLSDTRLAGVVLDRPDADRCYAWGPFSGFDTAARFAEFVQAEIDPARVLPWAEAEKLPGVRVLDAVTELLNWRTSVALPSAAASVRNCFTDDAYRSSLTASPEKSCGRSKAHPAHKHIFDRASWQCPGVAAPTS